MCVVNWFQNFVSLWSETVIISTKQRGELLWIGFKILYLCGLKQFSFSTTISFLSCELVSKFCIFVVWNSTENSVIHWQWVVNWFQNFVSLWSETVGYAKTELNKMLWIGFKILYLCGLKQSLTNCMTVVQCCELVSKFCIFVVWNSERALNIVVYIVVNWFQNFVSLWSETVIYQMSHLEKRCELVSKFCIFVVWNSNSHNKWIFHQLWIGFKILYLCGLKQCNSE